MYLFFDTETNGLPKSWNASVHNVDNWPRVVELAWALYDTSGQELEYSDTIIKPDGWTIPDNVAKVHGITQNKAEEDGSPVQQPLLEILHARNKANVIIGHNVDFDTNVVGAELIRAARNCSSLATMIESSRRVPRFCTMKSSTSYCALPSQTGRGYKWPKLQELHEKCFGNYPEGLHNALVDVRACARCFFYLKEHKIIECSDRGLPINVTL